MNNNNYQKLRGQITFSYRGNYRTKKEIFRKQLIDPLSNFHRECLERHRKVDISNEFAKKKKTPDNGVYYGNTKLSVSLFPLPQ